MSDASNPASEGAKVLKLITSPEADLQAQGREILRTLLDAGDPDALALFADQYLLENGRLTSGLPWCDGLLEIFFSHPSLQIHPTGGAGAADVRALDLSPLACEEGRLTDLSWLRHLPGLKRLDISCQAVNAEMVDALTAAKNLEWVNTFGCAIPWNLRAKLADIGTETDETTADLPRGGGRFFQCNETEPDEFYLRDYRIGSAAVHIVKQGRLQRIYFVVEGYSGGGCLDESAVRLDFHEDGTVTASATYYGFGEYHRVYRVFPEEEELEGDVSVGAVDEAIFNHLLNRMGVYREFDEEDWDNYRPNKALLDKLKDQTLLEGTVNTSLMFGLARPVLSLLTYWRTPTSINEFLDMNPAPFPWLAYGDARPQTEYLIQTYLIDALEAVDEFHEVEEGSPEQQAIIDQTKERLLEWTGTIADRLGWKLMRKLDFKDKHGTPKLQLLYGGEGWLYDYDSQLLELSAEHDRGLSVVDLTNELLQSYYDGHYDSGSICAPGVKEMYAEYARELRETIKTIP